MANTLVDAITPEIVATQIRMERAVHKGSFLVLEGVDDSNVLKKFIDNDSCSIVIAHGKDRAIGAIQILDADGFPGVLAIIDADFMRIEGTAVGGANLLLTDEHDLELMLVRSNALPRLLEEFGSVEKIRRFELGTASTVLDALLQRANVIGSMRLLSQREELGLDFQEMDYAFVDARTMAIDRPGLIRHVIGRSRSVADDREVSDKIDTILAQGHPNFDLCHGKDVIGILARGLRGCLGSQSGQVAHPLVIEKCLRLAFDMAAFSLTRLFAQVRGWESANAPYVVLA